VDGNCYGLISTITLALSGKPEENLGKSQVSVIQADNQSSVRDVQADVQTSVTVVPAGFQTSMWYQLALKPQ